MITPNPRLDELSPRRNKPPQDGGINLCPHILGIQNCEDTDLTMDSSKPCVTGINSLAVQAWRESADNLEVERTQVNPAVTRKHTHAFTHQVESVSQGPHPCWQGRINSGNRLNSVPPHPSYRDRQLRSFWCVHIGAEITNWACRLRLDAYAWLHVVRTHRLQLWPSRFCCDLLIPFALSGHFHSELRLLNPETVECTYQGIVRNGKRFNTW
ncbi:hypothetical protein PIB30_048275 [Stylosanthes scabra]|uniref:Uncharacterized protein n=1 Tax=Stylosanthes scabra TaxID=79078 RepID=A0ABU6SH24_9FABA|nr:hypothetical protein [Stylosanthes scabra]